MGSDTESFHIGAKAAQTNYYAHEQAERLGLPLTHGVTINFSSTALDPRVAVPAFSRLRANYFNKWARRPRHGSGVAFEPTYVFAFENVRDKKPFLTMAPGDPHNVHVHWQMHLPPSREHDFRQLVWTWLEAVAGPVIGGGEAIHIGLLPEKPNGYLLKGTRETYATLYARGQKAEPQGIIIGRRADTSRNLGPKARRAADQALGLRRRLPRYGQGQAMRA